MQKLYYVYILASRSRNLYAGVTNNLWRRVFEHRESQIFGFTKKYRIHRLVHFEAFGDVRAAIEREKQIKSWRREKIGAHPGKQSDLGGLGRPVVCKQEGWKSRSLASLGMTRDKDQ